MFNSSPVEQAGPLGRPLLDKSAVGLRSVYRLPTIAAILLLDKDESCPTSDLSNIGRPNGPAYSTGE